MKSMDMKTLFSIALQYQKVNYNDIKQILNVISFGELSSVVELKKAVEDIGRSELYPKELSWNYALDLDDKNQKYQVRSFSIVSNGYPNHLKAIDNPPLVLHVRGNVNLLQEIRGVAIVGARKTSKAGLIIANRIAKEAVDKGWVVVSGLALGIDASAHAGALSTGKEGATVAVLAHGLEKAKPVSNQVLGGEILENGGAWVSEHAIGVPARPAQFVQRNRIQLGLSVGSIIVEAEEKSGSITQAKFCLQQKRPLFAVVPEKPENTLGLVCTGTKMLVDKMGANPLRSKDDYPAMFERFTKQKAFMG
jgi:DNA processing protein